jgi:hypothetical protein
VTVRTRALAAGVILVVLAGVIGYLGLRHLTDGLKLPKPAKCTVRASDESPPPAPNRSVTLDPGQMANAATIAAVGVRRNVPARGVVVALATALQESKLENLGGGDRDSVGLFQQRPSQGWGTAEQLQDVRFAADRFYAALQKVRGWEKLRVTEAAQAVQRSAFPEAYEKWTDDSSVLARALLGQETGAVACTVAGKPAMRGNAAAAALIDGLLLDWGHLETATPTDHTGLSVSTSDAQAGWRYAHWLVSNAGDHGVKRVRFDGLEWTADEGIWSRVPSGADAATGRVVAEVFAEA